MYIIIDNSKKQKTQMFFPLLVAYFVRNKHNYIILDGDKANIAKLQEIKKQGINVKGIILGGSPLMLDEGISQDDYKTNLYCLKHFQHTPILGICFGCQVINSFYGGSFVSLKYVHCKKYRVEPLHNDNKFNAFNAQFCAKYMPNILGKDLLPICSVIINKNNYICGFKHKTKNIYGVMFHPEANQQTHIILDNFIKMCNINIT
jgi:anthranilate/para-aminobenzoate synthase component II